MIIMIITILIIIMIIMITIISTIIIRIMIRCIIDYHSFLIPNEIASDDRGLVSAQVQCTVKKRWPSTPKQKALSWSCHQDWGLARLTTTLLRNYHRHHDYHNYHYYHTYRYIRLQKKFYAQKKSSVTWFFMRIKDLLCA